MSTSSPTTTHAAPSGVGLTSAEAQARLRTHGPNHLTEAPGRPAWRVFVDQFRNLLVIVLIAAAVLAGVVGDLKDVVVITVVLLLNAVLGFVQEHRADQSLAALRSMLTPTTRARRDGRVVELAVEELPREHERAPHLPFVLVQPARLHVIEPNHTPLNATCAWGVHQVNVTP